MKLIANWRKAYKMLSIQAMAFATAIQGAWMFIPEDMKATDHSFCDETPETPELGHMVCGKCGHEAGWMHFKTRTEVRRGEPCPICNRLAAAPSPKDQQ